MKAIAKATLTTALILFCIGFFNTANAQARRQNLNRIENRRDHREDLKDRKENVRDRKEDRKATQYFWRSVWPRPYHGDIHFI